MNVGVHHGSTPISVFGFHYPAKEDGPVDFDVWTLELRTTKGTITLYFRELDAVNRFVSHVADAAHSVGA